MTSPRTPRRPRRSVRGRSAVVAVATLGAVASVSAPAAAAPAEVPCTASGGGHHDCRWRVPGDGRSAGAPVLASNGTRVGYLHQGTNWIVCQGLGRRERDGAYFNRSWGFTTADNGRKGWVNAVWARGGDNDGGFAGVPSCGKAQGTPPGGAPTPAPAPPAPAPDSCANTREGQTATLTYRFRETRRHVILPGNVASAPATEDEGRPRTHRFGTIVLSADTCRSPRGWRVLQSVNVRQQSVGLYQDASDHAAIRGSGSARGWGLGIAAARDGSFDVQYTACRKGSGWAITKALFSLPIKGLPFAGSLAKYAVTKLLPSDGTRCDDLGVSRVTLTADRRGRLVVRSKDLSFGQVQTRTTDDPRDPGDYHEHTKAPTGPRIVVR